MIFLCAWKRPEITKACYKGIHRIKKTFAENGVEADVFVTVSEDYHAKLAEENGFKWHMTDNNPVGQKHHNGLQAALRYSWDYIMQMGSDDIISDRYINECCKLLNENYEIIGSNYYYFYNLHTGEDVKIKMKGHAPGGAGRFVKRSIINLAFDQLGFFWQRQKNRGLDGSSLMAMYKSKARYNRRKNAVKEDLKIKTIHFEEPEIVDIKSEDSMNSYNAMMLSSEDKKNSSNFEEELSKGGFKTFGSGINLSYFEELEELISLTK